MNVYEKLLAVQTKLKAPKSQYNSFGKYNYRNCEDILEAVKPLCAEVKAVVRLTDRITMVGDRYYVEATARFVDCEGDNAEIITTAYAREEEEKKGMDGSQVTGASSSYARKYALNGLFDIDDTKDSDTTNTHGQDTATQTKQTTKEKPKTTKEQTPRERLIAKLKALGVNLDEYAKAYNLSPKTTDAEFEALLLDIEERSKS